VPGEHLRYVGALPRARAREHHAEVLGEHTEQGLDRQRAVSRVTTRFVRNRTLTG
jgi:hypothetical protein